MWVGHRLTYLTICSSGGIGRRTGLKIPGLNKACGFKSHLEHHLFYLKGGDEMKVLKEGKLYCDYIAYCNKCEAKIAFSRKEVQSHQNWMSTHWIFCPCCGEKINVDNIIR